MSNCEIFVAPTEFKFVDSSEPGAFEGYGSVYGILDSHKDVIDKGAFDATLAEHALKGTMPGLYVEHSPYVGGDLLPVGVYTEMKSDDHGLAVKGKISALDTDYGKRIRGLMADGALKGLSIAFSVPPGGARMGKKAGEPRRTLTAVNLHSVDIVRSPSNSAARIQEIKSVFRAHLKEAGGPGDPNDIEPEDTFAGPDVEDAIEEIAAAIILLDQMMTNSYGGMGDVKSIAMLMSHIQEAYEALTGDAVPDGLQGWTKSNATLRMTEKILREEFELSHARARDVAKRVFGSLPRDEGSTQADAADQKTAVEELRTSLAGFSFPTF